MLLSVFKEIDVNDKNNSCDDEIFNLKNLEIILNENFPEIEILGLFQTVKDAKLFIKNNSIDLFFEYFNINRKQLQFYIK